MPAPSFARRLCWILAAVALLAATGSLVARTKAPAWVLAAAEQPVAVETGDAAAVVLWDDSEVEVERTGRVNHHSRWVIRLLRDEGRDEAVASASYLEDAGRVRSIKAWLVSPDGRVREYGKKERVDVAAHASALELYGESRVAIVADAATVARKGDVFAYEIEWMDESDWAELHWTFRSQLPVVRSAIAVTLPAGWDFRTKFSNHPGVAPEQEGRTHTWTLRNLPGVGWETWSPRSASRVIEMSVALIAPSAESRTRTMIGVESWQELGAYFAGDYERASTPDATVRAAAVETVAGAENNWERIQRLCRQAQNVRYISVALDVGRSGGYRPRAAADVQRVGYGDCKDKSVYLRALLRAVGLDARELLVSSGARYEIETDWVSPAQFNHCVLSIPLDESAPGDVASFVGPEGRRWLVFDPTDEYTPPGRLDSAGLSAQGFWLSAEQGGLVELPALDPARSSIEREIELSLDEHGAATGRMRVTYRGDDASPLRAWLRRTDEDQRKRGMKGQFRDRWTAPTIDSLSFADEFDDDSVRMDMTFSGEGYARLMRNVLFVFNPVVLPTDLPRLKAEQRENPIRLSSSRVIERMTFTLPPGYMVDEAPEPVTIEAEFGSYLFTPHYDEVNRRVEVERRLEWLPGHWPKELASEVESFVEQVRETEQTPYVLERE